MSLGSALFLREVFGVSFLVEPVEAVLVGGAGWTSEFGLVAVVGVQNDGIMSGLVQIVVVFCFE